MRTSDNLAGFAGLYPPYLDRGTQTTVLWKLTWIACLHGPRGAIEMVSLRMPSPALLAMGREMRLCVVGSLWQVSPFRCSCVLSCRL